MLTAFGISTLAVTLAEMGDKTQLLAMACAARFRWQTVLSAIFVATALNHLLAVIAGSAITALIPIVWVKLLAALSFMTFSLWTLYDDSTPGACNRTWAGPFMTVAVAFFIAEMGDKTQLMTMTLAADQVRLCAENTFAARAIQILPVWMGTTVGMMTADSIGIVAGIVLNKRIPTQAVKWVAAIAFAVFGIFSLHENLCVALHFNVHAHLFFCGIAGLQLGLMFLVAWINKRHGRVQDWISPDGAARQGLDGKRANTQHLPDKEI